MCNTFRWKTKAKWSTLAMACTRDSCSSLFCLFGHIDILLFQLCILPKGISLGRNKIGKRKNFCATKSAIDTGIQGSREWETGKIWTHAQSNMKKWHCRWTRSWHGQVFVGTTHFLKWTVCQRNAGSYSTLKILKPTNKHTHKHRHNVFDECQTS